MDADLKPSAFAAAGMLVVSLLIGIVSGIEFLTLVFRALLFGALFGAFVFGAIKLIRTFVPDLIQGDEEAVERKGGVDIVISDDDGSDGFLAEEAVVRAPSSPAQAGDAAGPGSTEVASGGAPGGTAGGVSAIEGSDGDFDLAQEAETLRHERIVHEDDGQTPAKMDIRPPDVFEDLDVLPDMAGFADSFGSAASDEEEDIQGGLGQRSGSSNSNSNSKSASRAGDIDPVEMAKAVRTILQRDSKG